jgi:hypothetical protein
MIQGRRGVDDSFLPSHKLYSRIRADDVVDGQIIQATIKIKDQSVNWSKYCCPWDVVFGYAGMGVAQIYVADLPEKLPETINIANKEKFHGFLPKHVPEPLNYAHSEIKVRRGDELLGEKDKVNNEAVKKLYRALIAQKTIIMLLPKGQ